MVKISYNLYYREGEKKLRHCISLGVGPTHTKTNNI